MVTCVWSLLSGPDHRDPASAEGLRERPGEDGHRPPHPGPGTRGGEEAQQEDRREGAEPGLPQYG